MMLFSSTRTITSYTVSGAQVAALPLGQLRLSRSLAPSMAELLSLPLKHAPSARGAVSLPQSRSDGDQ